MDASQNEKRTMAHFRVFSFPFTILLSFTCLFLVFVTRLRPNHWSATAVGSTATCPVF